MFVGHYSASFVGKAYAPRVPFWVLLLAAQLVDVAWASFVLLGIERFHLDPSLPSNALVLDYMPFTHSLVATLAWAGLAAVLVSARPDFATGRAARIVALVVCSHWLLDVLVHRPDMTLWGEPRFGLALWDRPVLAYVVEIGCLAGAAAFYATSGRVGADERRLLVRSVAALVLLQTFSVLGPAPTAPTALVLTTLGVFLVIPCVAARLERGLAR
jgi:membrane-bound metal-dependent hydrolase YbcI (DUF457 family)